MDNIIANTDKISGKKLRENIEENIKVIVDIYDQNDVKQDSIKNVGEYKMVIREGEYTPNSQTNLEKL